MSRYNGGGKASFNEEDAQLAARLAKLNGTADTAHHSHHVEHYSRAIDTKPRLESDLVDDILSQAMEEAQLEKKHSTLLESSLEQRLARLKGSGASSSTNATLNSSEPANCVVTAAKEEQSASQPTWKEDLLEWISSDDETIEKGEIDDQMLEKVILMALESPDFDVE